MPGNTTRSFPDDRRASRRVPVLFSAILKREGWRSQIAEVVDLSDSGAKVLLRFHIPVGSHVVLRVPGSHGKLEVPATIANCAQDHPMPMAGLRFHAPEPVRKELQEIVERVERARKRIADGAVVAAPAPVQGGTRVTRRTTRTKRTKKQAKGGPA